MISKIKLEPNYKPSEDEEYMCPKHLEYFKRKLLLWKEELLQESRDTLNHLKEENWHEPDPNIGSAVDINTELRVRSRGKKLIEKIDITINNINNSIRDNSLKSYGYCAQTKEPIGLKRLEARPVATLSLSEQERREKFEKQYKDDDED